MNGLSLRGQQVQRVFVEGTETYGDTGCAACRRQTAPSQVFSLQKLPRFHTSLSPWCKTVIFRAPCREVKEKRENSRHRLILTPQAIRKFQRGKAPRRLLSTPPTFPLPAEAARSRSLRPHPARKPASTQSPARKAKQHPRALPAGSRSSQGAAVPTAEGWGASPALQRTLIDLREHHVLGHQSSLAVTNLK